MKKKIFNVDELAQKFLTRCQKLPKISVAVVHPCSEEALNGAIESAQLGLIEPILIAPEQKLLPIAKQCNVDLSKFTFINVPHSHAAAEMAVKYAKEGKVDALMKGSLHTDELMTEVIKKETGLRTERRISHVFVMAIESYHKPFIITDAAINIYPDLMTKKDIVQNAIDLMNILNADIVPKVAILSAVETINPEIHSTIDAACLCKMSERGQITGGIIDGPFAYDNVMSLQAAKIKHIMSPVIGDTDIFLVPDLESGNLLAKQMNILTKALSAGMILGAKVPIVLTSRSDGVKSRISSCCIAVLMVHAKNSTTID